MPIALNMARIRFEQTHKQFCKGCLAAAIGTYEAYIAARRKLTGKVCEDGSVTKGNRDFGESQGGSLRI